MRVLVQRVQIESDVEFQTTMMRVGIPAYLGKMSNERAHIRVVVSISSISRQYNSDLSKITSRVVPSILGIRITKSSTYLQLGFFGTHYRYMTQM